MGLVSVCFSPYFGAPHLSWESRSYKFAFYRVDVNYGGSYGYGRKYMYVSPMRRFLGDERLIND